MMRLSGLTFLFAFLIAAGSAIAAPRAELWERWAAQDPQSRQSIDHTAWDGLLATYRRMGEDGIARFDYGAVTPDDRSRLDEYLGRLADVRVTGLARPEQLAFWLNAYNALTVQIVLAHYPVRSIRDIDISPGWFADGPWGKKLFPVEGEMLSLDDIEHRILRPIWQSPLIHYGVNCASLGCPDLPGRAFTAATAEQALAEAARAYINHSRGVLVGPGGLTLSTLYSWYAEDFGADEAGLLAHLATYAAPILAAQLAASPPIRGYAYDWALNDTSSPTDN